MKTLATVAILILATLTWPQSSSTPPGHEVAKPQPAKPAQKKRSPEQKMWCPVLEYALSGAKSFEPPMRAYLLDTISLGLGKCDVAKVRIALVDSFTATLEIPEKEEDLTRRSASGDRPTRDQAWYESFCRLENKRDLQNSALMDLLSVDKAKAELLLDLAEPSIRVPILSEIISKAVSAKNYDHALELLNRIPPSPFFYIAATELMLALPPSRDTDKQEIFRLAMAADREEHSIAIGGDDNFAGMIVRFWRHVPPAVALEAIHQVLDAAKSMKDFGITLNASSGKVAFTSEYDYRVFELEPILRELGDSEADEVLSGSQQAQSQLQQFPNGLQSINPVIRDTPPKEGENAQISSSVGPVSGIGQVLQEANTADAYNSRMKEIVRMAENEPRQAIAAAATLPDSDTDPDSWRAITADNLRANALLAVAQAVIKKNPSVGKEALEGMAEALKSAPHPYRGMRYWVEGMNLAKQVGEDDLALKLFRSGMDQADKLGREDADSDDPNLALKAWWPSVSAAWQLVRAASEISPGVALQRVREIKDPEVLLLLEVSLANKGLGAGIDRSITITKVQKKSPHDNWGQYMGPAKQ